MLGADGKPRPELFVQDGLHLNEAGYTLWNALLRPLLEGADDGGNRANQIGALKHIGGIWRQMV
jgi:hypothetical protein